MSFVESIKSVFTNYVNFNGRARRSEYWWFCLANAIVGGILSMLSQNVGGLFSVLSTIYTLAVFLPALAVEVRRLHDIGKRWTWLLFVFIPLVGWIFLVVWFAKDSDPGENAFGPNPKQ